MDNHQFPQEQTLNLGINVDPPPPDDPPKRRPGRPKGSVKKALLGTGSPSSKTKRPVGRPRKDGLPAGSVPGTSKHKRERTSQSFFVPDASFQGVAYPSTMAGYHPPVPQFVTAPVMPIDPSLTADEWSTLARTDANQFLAVLLVALAAPNPVSSGGPTVEEAFKMHLASVAPNQNQAHPIPSLYSILKTFWLPASPAYFSLTASAASTARTPSEHRFLYWDPLPLVFNGIACPQCGTPLLNRGRISSGPLKIYDIEKPFFIIGCEYVCKGTQCTTPATPEGRKFASTDSSILRALPIKLKDEFPAKLLYDNTDAGSGPNIWNWKALGVSWSLWNMVHGALRAGLKKDVILHLIHSIQRGVPTVDGDEPAREPQRDNEMRMEEDDNHQQQPTQQAVPSQQTQTPAEHPIIQNSDNVEANDFTDAYNNAWKEHTAVAENTVKSPAPQQPQPSASTSTVIPPTQTFSYPYPFTPYAYMGAHLVNGQMVALASPAPQVAASVNSANHAGPSDVDNSSISAAPHPSHPPPPPQQEAPHPTPHSTGTTKRSPRHCCKCGSQDCKGKGGRTFCMNACQDCGKLDCKGRNSRRPDKKCSEGWT
ncbi:hypothetical protein D9611_001345 [Ephemerocybe angulata]|uniref:Uncharacterized protein n=1 Tax=Ephemerocybe angulata TaxID=980116 RepID=A0A8H5CIR3_9AGAR|nr:hypothetical protein D9611_001345 [Tulosesus angulatus]